MWTVLATVLCMLDRNDRCVVTGESALDKHSRQGAGGAQIIHSTADFL